MYLKKKKKKKKKKEREKKKSKHVFKQDGAISTLNDNPLKLVDHFTYLCSNISSTESIGLL